MSLTPAQVVDTMMKNDRFSQWLGIRVIETGLGKCVLEAGVREEMLNGFYIAHGGITYAVSDSALAFASNSYGKKAVSVETSISHLKQVKPGDVLSVTATEISRTNRIGLYEVRALNQLGELVSVFKGTVYITDKNWD